jgi:hypothetical protein
MSNVSSIFNTSFFVILGIIILVVGLLVIYFENKIREQNHKMSSMLSLVSSLAEELNAVKFHLNKINMIGAGMKLTDNSINIPINSSEKNTLGENLIPVSDDEENEDDENEDDEDELEETNLTSDSDEENDDETDSESTNENDNELIKFDNLKKDDIKILNIQNFNDSEDSESDESDDDMNDDIDLNDDSEDENVMDLIENLDIEEINDEIKEEIPIQVVKREEIILNDLQEKEIFVNLEKKNIEVMDYKKLSLNKLKTLVLDKGLSTDTSKMKKNELLKLLGVE